MNARVRPHPQVAVVVPLIIHGASPSVQAIVDRVTMSALRLLAEAGAEPWVVDTSAAARPAAERVAAADGVLLLGGGDMDPSLYGVHTSVPELYGVDRDSDIHGAMLETCGSAGKGRTFPVIE